MSLIVGVIPETLSEALPDLSCCICMPRYPQVLADQMDENSDSEDELQFVGHKLLFQQIQKQLEQLRPGL